MGSGAFRRRRRSLRRRADLFGRASGALPHALVGLADRAARGDAGRGRDGARVGPVPTARLIAAALLLAAPARGAGSVSAKRRELGTVQKELEAARRQIEDYKRQEQALGRDLMKLETRNAEARKRMGQLQGG